MSRAPVASLLLATMLVAACGSGTPSSSAVPSVGASSAASAQASQPAASAEGPSTGVESSAPTIEPGSPGPNESAADSLPPDASTSTAPTESAPSSPLASPSGDATACAPAGDNPNFWQGIAASVSWDVYCAVLPKGWSVSSGSYRLANGGKLVISYKGPSGVTLTLSEGSFCADGSGCVPSGSDTGDASFGSMSGTLVTTDAGGFAIVAARGETPSWLMVTGGLDQATTMALGAALALVH